MTQIDWSNQPKGFPLWLEGVGEHACWSGWYKRQGDIFKCMDGGQFKSFREGQFFNVHTKPEPVWTGAGLPPVGTTVEIHRGKWNIRIDSECFLERPVTVAAAFKMRNGTEMVAVDGGPEIGCEVFRAECVRPVHTPEQIAKEEREAKAMELFQFLNPDSKWHKSDHERWLAAIDAGWQKVEK